MSPLLTSTPAPAPTYAVEGYWPSYSQTTEFGATPDVGAWAWRGPGSYWNEPPNSGGAVVVGGPGVGGTGVTSRIESVAGVALAARMDTTSAVQGQTTRLPWAPSLTDPAPFGLGGLITREDCRVCWLREVFINTGNPGDAGCGRVLSLDDGTVAAFHWAQAGDAVQQFGIYGDGAGGLQYRSYSRAPALLETIQLAPNVLAWNVADYILTSSAPGRTASFRLKLNGVTVVTRNFGVAALPYEFGPSRVQLVQRQTSASTAGFYVAYRLLRLGRFTPEGLELRS